MPAGNDQQANAAGCSPADQYATDNTVAFAMIGGCMGCMII